MFRELYTLEDDWTLIEVNNVRRTVRLILVACTMASALLWCSWCVAQQEQGETNRKIVNKIAPAYPELARKMNITGSVKIEVVIAPNGSVKSEKVIGGHPVLAQSAQEAIRKWKWTPNAQETTELIDIKFNPRD
jgi:TonB family protein